MSSYPNNLSHFIAAVQGAAGNTVVTGYFNGTLQLGGPAGIILEATGEQDVVVAWLSPTGTWLRATRAGGIGDERPTAIALDAAGNIVVAGFFYKKMNASNSPVSFSTHTLLLPTAPVSNYPFSSDVFVACLSPASIWTHAVQGGGVGTRSVIAGDAVGNVTVAGNIIGASAAFGPFTLTEANPTVVNGSPFVARLNVAGA